MDEGHKEAALKAADETVVEVKRQQPAAQIASATHVCLQQLVALLIEKKVIEPQDALDAFSRASDDIQRLPDSAVAVRIVENLCSFVAKIPGAKRESA